MKNFLFFILLSTSLIFLSSCDKDENGSVELNFVASYDGTPVVIGNTYDYTDDVKIQFDDLKFFIADVNLEEDGGSQTSLTNVEFVEFDNLQTAEASAAGKSLVFNDIPEKTYSGLNMFLGLTKELNDTNPSDASADSPLLDGNYWSDWESYIFITISARADLDNDGTFEQNLVYHIGGEEAIRSQSFDNEIKVAGDQTTTVKLDLDLKKAFINDGTPFDIWNIPQVHKDRVVMSGFADALQKAWTIK